MKFGIVGNNDGPLYLLEGLKKSNYMPEFVGLQKPIAKALKDRYQQYLKTSDFFEDFNESLLLKTLDHYKIDVLINCFCNFKFERLLDQSFQVLNIHLSPLPRYRGRHPLQWALINGEKEFGVTIHKMTENYDGGIICWQRIVPVQAGMSVHQLRTRLMKKMQTGFADFLQEYEEDTINPVANNDDEACYVPRRYPEDSRLTEWDDSQKIYRKVMALRSEDYAAYILIDGRKVVCRMASPGIKTTPKNKAPYIRNVYKDTFQVVCADGQSIWLYGEPEDIRQLRRNQNL